MRNSLENPAAAMPQVQPGSHLYQMISSAVSSIAVRGLGPASSFIMTLFLAHWLGAADTGAFYLMGTLMTVAAIIAKRGFDNALQKHVGITFNNKNIERANGLYQHALKKSLHTSLYITVGILLFSGLIAEYFLHDSDYLFITCIIGLSVIPFTRMGVQAAMLKAIGRPIAASFIEAVCLPLLTLCLSASFYFFSSPTTTEAVQNVNIISLAFAVSAVMTCLMLNDFTHRRLQDASSTGEMMKSSLPLTVVELLTYLNLWLPLLVLGFITNTTDAGLFNIAQRVSGIFGIFLIAIASITSPKIASFYSNKQITSMVELAHKATLVLLFAGLPAISLLFIWPEEFLSLFGPQFTQASTILQVLLIGQVINLITGPVGYMLAMTGHEKSLKNILIATVFITILLSIFLIPQHGAIGAAYTVAIAMIFNNLAGSFVIYLRLGIPFLLIAPAFRRR